MKRLLIFACLLLNTGAPVISISHINSVSSFDTIIKQNEFVVIDFYMTTCGPCQALAPLLLEVEAGLPQVNFFKINIQDKQVTRLSDRFNIRSVPTLIIFKNGKEIGRIIGNNKTAPQLIDILKNMLELA